MSDSYLNAPIEDVTTLIIFIVGMLFIGLFIDWLRRKMGNYLCFLDVTRSRRSL